MTHTDTDIAEILERFHVLWEESHEYSREVGGCPFSDIEIFEKFQDFITRECLALKKKWEREHFDNQ